MSTTTIDPPQPQGQGEYPIQKLIPSYIQEFANQADYTSKTGKPAPAWNPALPKKAWIDTSVDPKTFSMVTYHTAHLDATFQHPVVTDIQVPSYLAGSINLPPDSGPYQQANTEYLTPIRALLPNEQLYNRQMGLFDVLNTDIYNPNAPAAAAASSSGGLTADQAAKLDRIVSKVDAIAAAMGIPL